MSIDYVRKSKVIANGLTKKISKIDKLTYLNSLDGVVRDAQLDNEYFDLCLNYDFDDIQEARKVNLASYKRTQRLRERIQEYLTIGQCFFITLNFSDNSLDNTNAQTRKKYVSKCLKSLSNYYVANIDFGNDGEYIDRKGNKRTATSREHYHALLVVDYIDNKDNQLWQYGQLNFEKVVVNDSTIKSLPKYINKLTNHAIKETTKRTCIIYSKRQKK